MIRSTQRPPDARDFEFLYTHRGQPSETLADGGYPLFCGGAIGADREASRPRFSERFQPFRGFISLFYGSFRFREKADVLSADRFSPCPAVNQNCPQAIRFI